MNNIIKYQSDIEQEKIDQQTMLQAMNEHSDLLRRNNPICHFTASSWIVNEKKDHVLMIYHKIYDSWAWTGGHVDGNEDFLAVAIKEAKEETGLKNINIISKDIFSLEILPVKSHYKNSKFIGAHLHFNVTYLLEAIQADPLILNDVETKGVKWVKINELKKYVSEKEMLIIYEKLNYKIKNKN